MTFWVVYRSGGVRVQVTSWVVWRSGFLADLTLLRQSAEWPSGLFYRTMASGRFRWMGFNIISSKYNDLNDLNDLIKLYIRVLDLTTKLQAFTSIIVSVIYGKYYKQQNCQRQDYLCWNHVKGKKYWREGYKMPKGLGKQWSSKRGIVNPLTNRSNLTPSFCI